MNTFRKKYPLFQIQVFTKGKNTNRNVDYVGHNDTTIALSDGATDKTGIQYDNIGGSFKTGGEIASRLLVKVALGSNAYGNKLIGQATEAVQEFYKAHNPAALCDSALRFSATLIAVKFIDDDIVITQVGDSLFRVNGKYVYANDKLIDAELAAVRAKHFKANGDIEGARASIMPRLKTQHLLQNNNTEELGYGVIDGATVPEKFIKTYRFSVRTIRILEIVSDGYFGAFPDIHTIDEYEKLREHVEKIDPYKTKAYASTKIGDDRTVAIVSLGASTT